MPVEDERFKATSARPASAEDFAESLKRRREAAKGLEHDIRSDVPMLYGSPDTLELHGDPGTVHARVHREELVRRNGGGVMHSSGKRSEVTLPFEGAMAALAVFLFLLFLFGRD